MFPLIQVMKGDVDLAPLFLLKAFKQMQPSKKGRDAEYTMGMKMGWESGRMI